MSYFDFSSHKLYTSGLGCQRDNHPRIIAAEQAKERHYRLHGKGNLGAKPKAEVIAEILQSIKERRA
jgi:hypothetical protein